MSAPTEAKREAARAARTARNAERDRWFRGVEAEAQAARAAAFPPGTPRIEPIRTGPPS